MPHHVYANDMEIAAKSADGKSTAFPDVCFSPPKPPKIGIPIPYPNTCRAKDITNGSRSVFIKKKEVALENKSYFKKSTGDEAATKKYKKGAISNNIKGRCYFSSWSPNVKVEGFGVTRNMDSVTHNHGSPSNQPMSRYLSERMPGDDCREDRSRIQRACREKSQNQQNRRNAPRIRRRSLMKRLGNLVTLPDDAAKRTYRYRRRPGTNGWMEDYCDGLWVKPMKTANSWKDMTEAFDDIFSILDKSPVELGKMLFGEMLDLAFQKLGRWFLIRKLGGLAARSVLKNIIGGAAATTGVGVVVTGAMAAWTITDVIKTATDIAEQLGPEGKEILDDLLDLDKLKETAQQKIQDYKEQPEKFLADMQAAQAARDPCIRARKCMLVPYNRSNFRNVTSGHGCCPGQTGHHVIPGAAMEGNPCYAGKHNSAPTVCLEGATNTHGSHGQAHTALKNIIDRNPRVNKGDQIPYEQQRDMSLDAMQQAILPARCNRKCLEKQLDDFYKNCKNSQVTAHDGLPGGTDNTVDL